MAMAGGCKSLILLVGLSAGILAALGQHVHHDVKGHDEYNITVSTLSGNAAEPTWIIDGESKLPDVKKLGNAIKAYVHEQMDKAHSTGGGHHAGGCGGEKDTLPSFPSVNGYRGMDVAHYVNGKCIHIWRIMKCDNIALEYYIINLTAGNEMSAARKREAFQKLRVCLAKKKAATKAESNTKPAAKP
ncbi:uncharacterized protein LOC128218903 [Mya arenaria]|uniref:uncharacterized protein LOC128218903 n=1 Tax=Mya arenaria TaxID=6604 RepID=UPI0022E93F4A|nr:uncharacterized protein LOC128218903 [Mya arenaria]